MKRYVSVVLASMLAVSSLTACSSDDKEEETNASADENQDEKQDEDSDKEDKKDKKKDKKKKKEDDEEPEEEQYSDIDKERMKDLNSYPGSTKSGTIEDVDAIENLVYAYFDSLQNKSGTYGDRNADVFYQYAYDKKFKDLTKKQKTTLFDTAYESGMFIPYNEKALSDDDKYNVISEALLARTRTNDPKHGSTYMVDFSPDDIRIEEPEGTLPTAFIPEQTITLMFYDDRTPDLNLGSIDNDYLRLNGGLHMVKYKGIWYVSKKNLDDSVRKELWDNAPEIDD